MRKRLLASLLIIALVFSLTSVFVFATGEWADINIYQKKVCHSSGCTTVTYQLILQNSMTLKPEWQLSGAITSRTDAYAKFDAECARNGLNSGDAVYYASLPKVGAAMCRSGVTWKFACDVQGTGSPETRDLSGAILVGKVGGKRFDAMTDSEVISVMKAFYNCGFFCAMGIYYVGNEKKNNGTSEYPANHWVMFTGVDNNGVYMNDPIYGSKRVSDCSTGGQYRIRYIVPLKNNLTSPLSLAGGQKAELTDKDKKNLGDVGIPAYVANGQLAFSDADLLSHCALSEPNLEDTLLLSSDVDNLSQLDLEQVEGWRTNIELEKNKFGFVGVLRWIISGLGIVLMIWALFVYLAFWYDHINSFFYIDMLHILTFGKLHICPPNEKPTFSMGKDVKDRTVNHLQICGICITALIFGALLVSGAFYKAVAALVNLVRRLIAGG